MRSYSRQFYKLASLSDAKTHLIASAPQRTDKTALTCFAETSNKPDGMAHESPSVHPAPNGMELFFTTRKHHENRHWHL
jgi:hypothetical protein